MKSEVFPRCVRCRATIHAGERVTFRDDHRVEHVECPRIVCPFCARAIGTTETIRRDGEQLIHANCWMRRYRLQARAG
jgi:hypothetical protein